MLSEHKLQYKLFWYLHCQAEQNYLITLSKMSHSSKSWQTQSIALKETNLS